MGTNGTSVLGAAPENAMNARLKAGKSVSGTRSIAAPFSVNCGGSDPDQVAWVDRKMTPMPLKSHETLSVLKVLPNDEPPKLFVRFT